MNHASLSYCDANPEAFVTKSLKICDLNLYELSRLPDKIIYRLRWLPKQKRPEAHPGAF